MGGRGASSGGSFKQKANSLVQRVRNEREKIPTIHASGELSGTEKQVSWANDIRSSAVKSINDAIRSGADQGVELTVGRRDAALRDTTRRGKKKTPERMERDRKNFDSYARAQVDAMGERAKQAKRVQEAVNGHKSASWWIDNRRGIQGALGYKGDV